MPALAGRALNLDNPGVPKRRLSSDLGEFLSWQGQQLSYAAGSTMWTVDMSQGLPEEQVTPEVKPKKKNPFPAALPQNIGTERALTLNVTRPQHQATLALTGAQLIPVDRDPIPNGVILIRGERIVAIGAAGEVEIPEGTTTMDLSGHSIYPGLVDVHAHICLLYTSPSPRDS